MVIQFFCPQKISASTMFSMLVAGQLLFGMGANAQMLAGNATQPALTQPGLLQQLSNGSLSAKPKYIFGRKLEQRLFGAWGVDTRFYVDDTGHAVQSDANAEQEVETLSIDVKRDLFDTDLGGVTLGVGVRRSFNNSDHEVNPHLRVTGRIKLGNSLNLYGETAWSPELSVADDISEPDVNEFEAGVSYSILPSMSVRAGIRWHNERNEDENLNPRRVMFGAGVRW